MHTPDTHSPRGLFIAGTDTGVGKTRVTAALLRAYARLGLRCVGMKPVAAGADYVQGQWVNEDVQQLRAASNVTVPTEWINPYLLREPIAPHIAAQHQGVQVQLPLLHSRYQALAQQADLVLVEGAGGLLVPLSDTHDMADLARTLALPVVLVVGMRLGCLNHALLTQEALRARGLHLAAWVANRIDPDMLAYDDNLATLTQRLAAPLLAELPHAPAADAARVADGFAPKRLSALLPAG